MKKKEAAIIVRLPEELRRELKSRLAKEGRSLNEFLLSVIEIYLKDPRLTNEYAPKN